MRTINNTDLEPMPLHDKGKWLWNGYEITGTGVTQDGEDYQEQGIWVWVSEDTQQGWMANATMQEIDDYYRPPSTTTDKAILWNIRRAVRWSRNLEQAQFRFRGLQWENGMGTTETDFETLKIEFERIK